VRSRIQVLREQKTHVYDISCISYRQIMNGLQVVIEGCVPCASGGLVSTMVSREMRNSLEADEQEHCQQACTDHRGSLQ